MTDDFVTYDPASDTYQAEFAPGERDSVSDAIVFAIAEISDRDAKGLEPLGLTVDTDALSAIFRPDGESTPGVSVTFEYVGFLVTVRGDGSITLEERD